MKLKIIVQRNQLTESGKKNADAEGSPGTTLDGENNCQKGLRESVWEGRSVSWRLRMYCGVLVLSSVLVRDGPGRDLTSSANRP